MTNTGDPRRLNFTQTPNARAAEPAVPDEELQAGEVLKAWRLAIPKRYWNAELVDVDLAVVDDLREWSATPTPPNLLVLGPVGTGKTHAAIAAVRSQFFAGVGLRFTPIVEMLDDLRPGGPDGVMDRLCRIGRLVIDDIATEKATDWTGERLFAVVNRRWLEERPTVSTTNLSPGDLRDALGERSFSRLIGSDALVLTLRGLDRRRARKQTEVPPRSTDDHLKGDNA